MEYLEFISIWIACTLLLALLVISLAVALFPVVREYEPEYKYSNAASLKPKLSKSKDRI
jgi:hypothetical protein